MTDGTMAIELTAEERARVSQRRERAADLALFGPGLDPGIRRYVEILHENGVETVQSCQGGPHAERPGSHAYPDPTVDFVGGYGAGWWALQVCLDYDLPVHTLGRVWSMDRGEPTGPIWRLTFRSSSSIVSRG